MPFNSLNYFLFLPAVYLLFYFAGERARWCVLLAASLLFYAALDVPILLGVLVLVAIATNSFAIWLAQAETQTKKRALLWGGILVNLSLLVVMKYLPFLHDNLMILPGMPSFSAQIQPLKPFAAIGVSYYVFQAISYLSDIYLEIEKPERHFGYFALYLAFFPKLLQGPIERAGDLIPQLRQRYEFNYDNMRFGMVLFAWGLFKKLVLADRLGRYVDVVYGDVHSFTGLPLLFATYTYAFQIYLDFSGYTDMALGSARLFNINLTQNFNRPYLATSVADFWRRWHISFSRWILDYIFRPLQMQWRNWKNWGTAAALIITFLASGIWHGASWGFVIWGGLHGLYLACSVFYKPYQKKLHAALGIEKTKLLRYWQVIVTFNLASFAWIFFRARNLGDSLFIVKNLLSFSAPSFNGGFNEFFRACFGSLGITKVDMSILLLNLVFFFAASHFRICESPFHRLAGTRPIPRWSFYFSLILLIILFTELEQIPFLYARY
jgi:alginate O-acetyltransferase complex protein AlgI